MWPWGHLAIGYITYAAYTRYRHDEHPTGVPVVVLTLATQLPDLVDKPLAYSVGVLPEGRSLAHSLLIAVPLCLLALAFARRETGWRARSGVAVAVGYATHLFGDSIRDLLASNLDGLTFLVWPIRAAPDYGTTSFDGHAEQFVASATRLSTGELTPFAVEWLLFVLMIGLWLWHRGPPLRSIRSGLRGAVG
ncbi:MAG: metal-dependent hydrolase [Halobacteriales archaeon]